MHITDGNLIEKAVTSGMVRIHIGIKRSRKLPTISILYPIKDIDCKIIDRQFAPDTFIVFIGDIIMCTTTNRTSAMIV